MHIQASQKPEWPKMRKILYIYVVFFSFWRELGHIQFGKKENKRASKPHRVTGNMQ